DDLQSDIDLLELHLGSALRDGFERDVDRPELRPDTTFSQTIDVRMKGCGSSEVVLRRLYVVGTGFAVTDRPGKIVMAIDQGRHRQNAERLLHVGVLSGHMADGDGGECENKQSNAYHESPDRWVKARRSRAL
ncbi:MAG: hypothetical protein P8L45_01155, partial [Longimicrobiales bacterium]|nr:hypothetical protein [Longimicrobiales bacterium]